MISPDSVQVRFLTHPKTTSLALAHVHNMATLALKLSGRSLLYSKSSYFPHPRRPTGQHPRASRRHSVSTHHSSYTSQRRATTAVPSPQTVLRSECSGTTQGVTPGLVTPVPRQCIQLQWCSSPTAVVRTKCPSTTVCATPGPGIPVPNSQDQAPVSTPNNAAPAGLSAPLTAASRLTQCYN